MIVTVNSQLLAAELRRLNKIVPTKPAIAILSHAIIATDAFGLQFYATDLELALTTQCNAQAELAGRVALPVARLLSLVEQFTDADVVIEADGTKAAVRCGAFKGRLQVMPVADFPTPAAVEGDGSELDAAVLRSLIARTRYAINASSSKHVLQGALLTLQGGGVAMVATDAKRLALATAGRTGIDQRFVVPAKALDVLSSLDDGSVMVTVGPRHLHFRQGDRLLTSRMLEGAFPAYERIIPRANDKLVEVERATLTAALKRIILVTEDNGAVYFNIEPGLLTLTAASAEIGSADEQVPVHCDAQLKVCISGRYVLDFLEAAVNPTVTLALKDANTAALLSDGDDSVAVIMTMRGN